MSCDSDPLAVNLRLKQLEQEVDEMRAFQRAAAPEDTGKTSIFAGHSSLLGKTLWRFRIRPSAWSKG